MFNLRSLPEVADFAERKLTACQAKIFAVVHDRDSPQRKVDDTDIQRIST
jgi:hypothetical protein